MDRLWQPKPVDYQLSSSPPFVITRLAAQTRIANGLKEAVRLRCISELLLFLVCHIVLLDNA
jgi:hypothetical protein